MSNHCIEYAVVELLFCLYQILVVVNMNEICTFVKWEKVSTSSTLRQINVL